MLTINCAVISIDASQQATPKLNFMNPADAAAIEAEVMAAMHGPAGLQNPPPKTILKGINVAPSAEIPENPALVSLAEQKTHVDQKKKIFRIAHLRPLSEPSELALSSGSENHESQMHTCLTAAQYVVRYGKKHAQEYEQYTQQICDRFDIKDPKYRKLRDRSITTGELTALAL